MKLTVMSDYSLRMLMHLAVNTDALVTITQIAARFGISRNHLMKVAHQLGELGFVETVRGRGGGLRLARRAELISVGDVVRATERHSTLIECFPGGKNSCIITSECRLKSVFQGAQNAFYQYLDGVTVAELVSENSALEGLLQESNQYE